MKKLSLLRGDNDSIGSPPKDPIEPDAGILGKLMWIKWFLLFVFILYMVISYLYVPILVGMGKFLVVKDEVIKSDLLVCLMGQPVERGLEVADLYHSGLSPKVFFTKEAIPDGYGELVERGVKYPETWQLLQGVLQSLGIPSGAMVVSQTFADNTMDEAMAVQEVAKKAGIKSVIIVTSPTHTRRALMAFRKAFEGMNIRISMVPSSYSGFDPMNWWKEERYAQQVLMEYMKLIYYFLRYR